MEQTYDRWGEGDIGRRSVGYNIVSVFYLTNTLYFSRLFNLGLSLGFHVVVPCIAVGIRFIIIIFV
jgi:hypothetical protein